MATDADDNSKVSSTPDSRVKPTVAVIGGGLAGLAAAVAAAECGFHVAIFEARRQLGGRAGSFRDPQSGELIDPCQHVSMGCCTNLADFCRRTGLADCFRRRRKLHFIAPDGRRCVFSGSRFLPPPLHLAPGLLRLEYLTFSERAGIARTMMRLARLRPGDASDRTTIGQWLRRQGTSDRVVERFWSVILVSALSEAVDRASLHAARKVFLDGFLGSRRAHEVEVPQLPLGRIYDDRLAAWLARAGVAVHRKARVRCVEGAADGARAIVLDDRTSRRFDYFVVAVPWRQVRPLFPAPLAEAFPGLDRVEQIEAAPITAVHVWFDRPITRLPDAVLVGRLSQWMFNRGRWPSAARGGTAAYYYQVVISASHELRGRKREQVVEQVRRELAAVWPATAEATLLRWRMVTHPEAVFSCRPGVDRLRPPQQTPVPNVALAGDWTATGWPSTMEGAVRSGYLAVESLLRSAGRTGRLVIPDLARGPVARWFFGSE